MQITKNKIEEDFGRDLFWTRIAFMSDDASQKTQIFTCASEEYLHDIYKLSRNHRLSHEQMDGWQNSVIAKWSKLGDALFKQDIHYDVYANTQKGEASGIDFLLSKTS